MDEQNQGFVNMGGVYTVRTFNSFSHELISSINDSEEFKEILTKESHQYNCGFSRCLDMVVKHLAYIELTNTVDEIDMGFHTYQQLMGTESKLSEQDEVARHATLSALCDNKQLPITSDELNELLEWAKRVGIKYNFHNAGDNK